MNKIFPLIIFIFSVNFSIGQTTFESAAIEKVNDELASEAVSGFVYVTGSWCVSCRLMEETTFGSEAVREALAGNYNAYKVDIESGAGKEWAAAFDICCLPTMLFLDSNGQLNKKIQAPLTPTTLSTILRNPNVYNSKPVAVETSLPSKYTEGTVVMEEVSFSEKHPKQVREANSENFSKGMWVNKGKRKEIIDYSEQKNNATEAQKKGAFLYHLSDHIKSMEELYIENAVSAPEQMSGIFSQLKTGSPEQTLSVSTSQKVDGSQLFDDTETLYELIQELKDWEDRLRNPDYEIRPTLVSNVLTDSDSKKETNINSDSGPKGYHIQMGFFENEYYAKRMAKDLKKHYDYPVNLIVENQPEGTFHRVLLGDFTSKTQAKKVYKKMKRAGRKAILKKD